MKPIRMARLAKNKSENVYISDDFQEPNNDDSEFEEDAIIKKKKAPSRKPKDKQWDTAFDDNGDEKKPKRVPRPRRVAKEQQNPNMIKSSNKMIGEIENKDLYNSDDDCGLKEVQQPANVEMRTDELDLGQQKPKEKKEMDFLLRKLTNKKGNAIEQQVVSLGIVQSLQKQISANELAARGIKLSLRDELEIKPRTKPVVLQEGFESIDVKVDVSSLA